MARLKRPGIILHNLSTRKQTMSIPQAHKGKVSGLCFSPDGGKRLLSCGVDRNIKLWAVSEDNTTSEAVSNLTNIGDHHNSISTHQPGRCAHFGFTWLRGYLCFSDMFPFSL